MTPDDRRQALLAVIASQVQIARAQRALSQARLARLADTDPGTLNKFLNGADIRVSTAFRIIEAAGLEIIIREKLPTAV